MSDGGHHPHLRVGEHMDEVVGGPARRRVILLFGSILGLQAADTGAVGALAAPLEKAFHIGNTDIGLLVTVTTLIGVVATLPFGMVADRRSRTRLLQIVVALWAAATLASSLSISFGMLLVTRLALGGVIAAAGPSLASLFGDLVPADERSRLWGYVLTGELVGAGIGILVAGTLSGPFGWRVAMGVLAAPAAVLAWAIRRWLPEPARGGQAYLHVGDDEIVTAPRPGRGRGRSSTAQEEEDGLGEPSEIELQAERQGAEPEPELVLTDELDLTLWQATRYVLRIRTNVALIVASGFGYFFLAGLETFAELYFRERYGVGQGLATIMFLVVAVGAVIGVVVSGRVTDGLIAKGVTPARVMVGAFAYAGTAVAFIPGALSHVLPLSLPIFFTAAFCIGAANPPVDAARLDIVPSRLWGRAEAVRTALRQILQGLAPFLFGLVSEAFGGGARRPVDRRGQRGPDRLRGGRPRARDVLRDPDPPSPRRRGGSVGVPARLSPGGGGRPAVRRELLRGCSGGRVTAAVRAGRRSRASRASGAQARAEKGISLVGRAGLAGRTGFYVILTGLTVQIARLGGRSGRQADAHGALSTVSRPLIGKAAIAAVAAGFLLFGIGRLIGAVQDDSVSVTRRVLTACQGLFYMALAYVPASFLAGRHQTGSQQQQEKTTARILAIPGGREMLVAAGVILIAVCAQQIRGALVRDFRDGLDLKGAPRTVKKVADASGVVGITGRALVFLPVGIFLIVSAVQEDPAHSYGTDGELLALSGHPWGIAVLAAVAFGLATFVVFSAIETRYRQVISAR